LLEVSFEHARSDPPQALILEVDRGRLAWDEQGEEGQALRVWADRHEAVVLRATGRFTRMALTVWHVYLDHHEIDGETVREGHEMAIAEDSGGATLTCGEDLTARIGVRQRIDQHERA
jgi:hypothetical protein